MATPKLDQLLDVGVGDAARIHLDLQGSALGLTSRACEEVRVLRRLGLNDRPRLAVRVEGDVARALPPTGPFRRSQRSRIRRG